MNEKKEYVSRIPVQAENEMMKRLYDLVQEEFKQIQKELAEKEPKHKGFIESLKCDVFVRVKAPI